MGAVPQTGEHPNRENIQKPAGFAAAVAAQGDIHIVPEPAAEGHVPAAPEIGDAAADIGIVEVFGEAEAEHVAQADGHIGIAGEVKIDLQGVEQNTTPVAQHRVAGVGEEILAGQTAGVGEYHFFCKTYHEAPQTGVDLGNGDTAVLHLLFHFHIPHDGSGHQLGEQADIQQHLAESELGLTLAPVNIDDIGHGLEGVEADAQRQGDLRHRNIQAGDGVQGLHHKAGVLKHAQQGQIDGNAYDQRRFFTAGSPAGGHQQAK